MLSEPAERTLVVHVATPVAALKFSGLQSIGTSLSRKETEPVSATGAVAGLVNVDGVTVAVKTTVSLMFLGLLTTLGDTDDVSASVLVAALTPTGRVMLLPVKLV